MFRDESHSTDSGSKKKRNYTNLKTKAGTSRAKLDRKGSKSLLG